MPVFQLNEEVRFPHPELAEENGLLAIGGDLSPDRLITGYKAGIFPWYSENDPILWWFTSPRLVIFTNEFKVPKRLKRYIRQDPFSITMDRAFREVITACAETRSPKREGTWITGEMIEAYCRLHTLGYAHSVECWCDGSLAGGLYGISLDRIFFGESMFTRMSNGSKIALVTLVSHLQKRGCTLIDCQMTTEHLLQFGAREISGKLFFEQLQKYILTTSPDGVWHNDTET